MTQQDRVHGVLLTEQAWVDLADALARYTSKGLIGKYIYCREVNPHRNYFVMAAASENPDGSPFEAEISIPHHYVKCVVTALEKTQIGFINE